MLSNKTDTECTLAIVTLITRGIQLDIEVDAVGKLLVIDPVHGVQQRSGTSLVRSVFRRKTRGEGLTSPATVGCSASQTAKIRMGTKPTPSQPP